MKSDDEKRIEIIKGVMQKQFEANRHIDVIEHAKIIRKILRKEFPKIQFVIKSNRFPGGTSVTVHHIGGDILHARKGEIKSIIRKFSGFKSSLMDDCHNTGFKYEGERLIGATFCSYNGRA